MVYADNTLLTRGVEALSKRLPPAWKIGVKQRGTTRPAIHRPDTILEICASDGTRGIIVAEAKAQVTGQQAAAIAPSLAAAAKAAGAHASLLITRFLSPLAQERLQRAGVSYLDLTGNARINLERPAFFILTQGADEDPDPRWPGPRSLKGPKAARLVRALCDWRPPVGVRELARRATADPGYAARIVRLLEREDIVTRDSDGGIATVRWRDLLGRWARDYQVTTSNRSATFLAPRGIDSFLSSLRQYRGKWGLTGSLAVPAEAVIAPTRLATCYVECAEKAADALGVRPTGAGANVLLLEPFDPVIWDRMRQDGGLQQVALSQCAVDLMTGTGREPSEGENLLRWMEQNEPAWRV